MGYTADELLTRVRTRSQLADGRLSDAELIGLANDVLEDAIVPAVMDASTGFYVTDHDVAITADQADYRIPSRALGGGLYDVQIVRNAGQSNESSWSVPHISLEDAWLDRGTSWMTVPYTSLGGYAKRFTVIGDKIRLVPTPTSTQHTLRMRYYRRPSELVLTTSSDAAEITDVSSAPAYTIDSADFSDSDEVDVVQANPGFDVLLLGGTVSSGGGTTSVTLDSTATDAAAGDYLCSARKSPVPQIPAEMWTALLHGLVAAVLEVVGDRRGADRAMALHERAIHSAKGRIQDRVEAATDLVISPYSPLRSGSWDGRT